MNHSDLFFSTVDVFLWKITYAPWGSLFWQFSTVINAMAYSAATIYIYIFDIKMSPEKLS